MDPLCRRVLPSCDVPTPYSKLEVRSSRFGAVRSHDCPDRSTCAIYVAVTLVFADLIYRQLVQTSRLPDGSEKQCCERGIDAIRRRTGQLPPQTDEFTIKRADIQIFRKRPLLGSGGFAKVYRGTYKRLRPVAIKVLSEATPRHVSIVRMNQCNFTHKSVNRSLSRKSTFGKTCHIQTFLNSLGFVPHLLHHSWFQL